MRSKEKKAEAMALRAKYHEFDQVMYRVRQDVANSRTLLASGYLAATPLPVKK
jgi:hypothetical protein